MPKQSTRADPILCRDQLQALQHILHAFGVKYFLQSMIWILTKVPTEFYGVEASRLVPFSFNPIQDHLYSRLSRMNRVLKARQAGMTTFFMLVRLFLPIITEGGKTGMLVSQNSRYAGLHFSMIRRAYRYIGALDPSQEGNTLCTSLRMNLLHTSYSSRRELVFDMIDSRLIVESAEVEEAGQGVTLHHVVASEVARWTGKPEDTTSNIKGALVKDGTYDEESTGNGMAGYFCECFLASMTDPKKADATSHFYPHWWSPEYQDLDLTPEQADDLLADLTADEKRVIAQMHRELTSVAYAKAA